MNGLTDHERIIAAGRAWTYPAGVSADEWYCGPWVGAASDAVLEEPAALKYG